MKTYCDHCKADITGYYVAVLAKRNEKEIVTSYCDGICILGSLIDDIVEKPSRIPHMTQAWVDVLEQFHDFIFRQNR